MSVSELPTALRHFSLSVSKPSSRAQYNIFLLDLSRGPAVNGCMCWVLGSLRSDWPVQIKIRISWRHGGKTDVVLDVLGILAL